MAGPILSKVLGFLCVLAIVMGVRFFMTHETKLDKSHLKNAGWGEMQQEVDTWVDEQGNFVDEKIKDTLIVMTLLEIPILAATEGRLEEGYPYPWVELNVASDQVRALEEEGFRLFEEIDATMEAALEENPNASEQDLLRSGEGELLNLYRRAQELKLRMEMAELDQLTTLYSYLDEFYSERTGYDEVLIIDKNPYRLRNQGADWQEYRSPEERAKKLEQYQGEMRAFTDFLIKKFQDISVK